jgi:hypothetical protein
VSARPPTNGGQHAATGTGAGIEIAGHRVGAGVALDSMRQMVALELTDVNGSRGLFAIDARRAVAIAVELIQRVEADPIAIAKRDPAYAAAVAEVLDTTLTRMRRR